MTTRISFRFNQDASTMCEMWNAIHPWFVSSHGKPSVCLNDRPISFDEIGETLHKARIKSANLTVDEKPLASLYYSARSETFGLSVCCIPDKSPPTEELIERLATSLLIVGREYNSEYERWQNESNVESYDYYHRSHAHLPKVWHEHIGMEVIDTSQNPGRVIGRKGYTEAIGSTMWLGPLFEERTGGDWREMKQYDWCKIEEQGQIVKIQSWETPFDSDQGEQRKRQEVLRRVLFPESCKH